MKQIFKSLVLVAAAVAALTSCEKAPEVTPPLTADEFTLTVNATLPAPEGTKTYLGEYDGTEYPVLWSEDDQIRLYEASYIKGEDDTFTSDVNFYQDSSYPELSADSKKATFKGISMTYKTPSADANAFDYLAVYGAAYKSLYDRNNGAYLKLEIPDEQVPTEVGQFYPLASILVASSLDNSTRQSSLDLNFKHAVAYAAMNITGLDCGEETIEYVTIQSDEYIAGNILYDYLDDTSKSAADSYSSQQVIVDMTNLSIADTKNFDVYFAAAPADFAASDKLTFIVETDSKTYQKQVTVEEAFSFVQGKILQFSVNFADADIVDALVTDRQFELVTSVDELASGDEIILVVNNGTSYLAASTYSSGKYVSTDVTPVNNVITVASDADIEVFTLNNPDADKWSLSCESLNGNFLGYGSSGTNFVNNSTASDTNKTYWTIEASTDNKFTIKNATTTSRGILYQFGAVNKFGAYSMSNATNTSYSEPYIYKKVTE